MNKKVVLFIILIGIVGLIISSQVVIQTFYPLKYKEQVLRYARHNHIDPYLALAVINTESRFNKDATSSKEAKGLMQLTESTAKEINDTTNSAEKIDEDTLYDVDVNIEIGCNYLASLITRYNGNYYVAVCAYNAGIGNVNKWIESDIITDNLETTDVELPFKETTNYLQKVIKNYKMYKILYPTLRY